MCYNIRMERNLAIPLYTNEDTCGYFPKKQARILYTDHKIFCGKNGFSLPEKIWFNMLLEKGFRRSGRVYYTNECQGCHECTPIRIHVKEFAASKSQRVVFRKNSDVTVKLQKNPETFVSERKIFLFREYDYYHNGRRKSLEETKETLYSINSGYSGVWNMEFYLSGELIAVSILDYGEDEFGRPVSLSSNYFYYDISSPVLKRSPGVFSVLKEIELCRELGIEYYYLGLYLPNCRKMNYKSNYKPYELYLQGKWAGNVTDIESYINEDFVIKFPKPGNLHDAPDVCCATEDMSVQLLYSAYMQGIFPWFNEDEGQPVIWYCPEKRFVLEPNRVHVSKSLKKFLKKNPYTYTFDTCFEVVMQNCAEQERKGQNGTWIGKKILKAYSDFHRAGYVHSVEVWYNGKLVGGFYGELIGSVFFGESMFTIEDNSSKSAFVLFAQAFAEAGGTLIDCQVYTENMERYGAHEISREEFIAWLESGLNKKIGFDAVKSEFIKISGRSEVDKKRR